MIANYLKISLRNLARFKGYTLINICGLALGLTCCLLILLYVFDELRYDHFQEHYNDIHRVIIQARFAGQDLQVSSSPAPLAFTMKSEIPEIAATTRIDESRKNQFRSGDRVFDGDRLLSVDSTFFDVFSFRLLQGDHRTVLAKPNSLVMTESTARKYFGAENPVGQILHTESGDDYTVTGVMADIPSNSHIEFDLLSSLCSSERSRSDLWISNFYHTYFRLHPGVRISEIRDKFNTIVRRQVGPQLMAAVGVTFEEFEKSGSQYGYYLEPMADIYLRSKIANDLGKQGNIVYVYAFSIIALFILLIACVNFMNLATARSANRAREVGIRKTLGSHRRNLISQFLAESVLLALLAVILALVAARLLQPFFNTLTGKQLSLDLFSAAHWYELPAILLFTILVGCLAGIYPAFYLSAFRPVEVLKGRLVGGQRTSWLRSTLVILQFAISIGLIFSTLIVRKQITFFQTKNLGFNKEHLLIVENGDAIGGRFESFKSELRQNPGVVSASFATGIPGHPHTNNGYLPEGASREDMLSIFSIWTDPDFPLTFGLELSWGRFFEAGRASDTLASIINPKAMEMMKWDSENPRRLIELAPTPDQYVYHEIIGVTREFFIVPLQAPMYPAVLHCSPGAHRYLAVRIRPDNIPATIDHIQRKWTEFAPDEPFNFYFYDDHYNHFYDNEIRTGRIFGLFTGLAIVIACLGLFGLAGFMTERRTREIGIRKTLGASVFGLVVLLVREFTKWVVIANLIAWPVAFLLIHRWLQNFAFHTAIGIWPFAVSAVIALVIAIMTVSFQSIRTALTNPARILKYE